MRIGRARVLAGLVAAATVAATATAVAIAPSAAGLSGSNGLIAVGTSDGIKVFDPSGDGSALRVLIPRGANFTPSNPAWSPRGDRIAYEFAGGIWVANADGSNRQRITPLGMSSVRNPAWSPDGRLSYERPGGLSIRDADGSNPMFVDPPGSGAWDHSWSPTGRLLVTAIPDGQVLPLVKVLIADGDGTRWREVTRRDGQVIDPGPSQPAVSSLSLFGWTADDNDENRVLALSTLVDGRHFLGPYHTIYYVNDYAFSPDGSSVVTLRNDSDFLSSRIIVWDLLDDNYKLSPSLTTVVLTADPFYGVDWQPHCTIELTEEQELSGEIVYGTAGDDVICGGKFPTAIFGGPGDDVIFGGRGSDRLYGESGNDVLIGGMRDDTMYGGLGLDLINSDGDRRAEDWVDGGESRDTCVAGNRDHLISCD